LSARGAIPSQRTPPGAAPGNDDAPRARRRVPAAERREELIAAAVHEFAQGGLHGTPVERIARRVGVAQPYVFSLFSNKRELFLAAIDRSFQRVADTFRAAAQDYREGRAADCEDALEAMGRAYKRLLIDDRDYLMLQHQSYAACDDEVVRVRVRHRYAQLLDLAQELSAADPEQLDDFFRHGMALNVTAALGVEDLSIGCAWVQDELGSDAPNHAVS
jgi:AcrR family transcriptional regulator